jgi:hypothetical protein
MIMSEERVGLQLQEGTIGNNENFNGRLPDEILIIRVKV